MLNNQTIQITNIQNKKYKDEELENLIITTNDNKVYKFNTNMWVVIPGVNELYLNNNPRNRLITIPAPHEYDTFNFMTYKIPELRVICIAYLLSSKKTKQETINSIKDRMRFISSMPGYSSTEYLDYNNSLPIESRGIKLFKKIKYNYIQQHIPLSCMSPLNKRNFQTKLQQVKLNFQRKLRLYYFMSLGPANMDSSNCVNVDDVFTMEPLSSLKPKDLFSFKEGKQIYGFEIKTLIEVIEKYNNKNPFTRATLPNEALFRFNKIKKLYPLLHNGENIIKNNTNYSYRVNSRFIDPNSIYRLNDELLLVVPDINNVFNVFTDLNNLHSIQVNNYLLSAQKFIKDIINELTNCIDIVIVNIQRHPINRLYIEASQRWGFRDNTNSGTDLLRILTRTKLDLINTRFDTLFARNRVLQQPYLSNIPNMPRETHSSITLMHNYLTGFQRLKTNIKRIIESPESFTPDTVNAYTIGITTIKQTIEQCIN